MWRLSWFKGQCLLRRAGKRTRGFIGDDDVLCHWGTTIRNVPQVKEKNYFAAMDYNAAVALSAVGIGLILWSAALLGPLTGTLAEACVGIAAYSSSVPAIIVARRLKWSVANALVMPLIYPIFFTRFSTPPGKRSAKAACASGEIFTRFERSDQAPCGEREPEGASKCASHQGTVDACPRSRCSFRLPSQTARERWPGSP